MDGRMAELAYSEPAAKVFSGVTGDWEIVIGMEVHAQVSSKSKLFSGASTAFGAEPNTQVSLVDAAGCELDRLVRHGDGSLDGGVPR